MSQTNLHNTCKFQNRKVEDSPAFVMRRLLGTIMQRFANARDPEFVKKDAEGYDLVEDSIDYVDVTDDDPAPEKVYLGAPKSESLTKAGILAAIESGIDPFASDVNGEPDRQFLHPPFTDLLVGARFAGWITSTGQLESLAADDAFYVVVEPNEQIRNVYEASLEAVCMLSAELFLAQNDDFDGFEVCVKDCDQQRLRSSRKSMLKDPGWRYKRYGFEKTARAALVENVPVIAVVKNLKGIPADLQVFKPVEMELPALSREMLVEILRVTHSSTGKLAFEAIMALLPGEEQLASLSLAAFERAFCAPTTLQVAKRLQDYATNLEEMSLAPVEDAPTGRTLGDMYLSDDVRRVCEQMLADLKAHQKGVIDWTEVPSSLFLAGPPGNGKTMLAEALAGSAGVKLFTTSYGDCQKHGHQGDFLKSLAAKVDWAIKHTPCVLFIDEFDSFTRRNKRDRNSDYIVGIVNTMLEHLTRLNETPGLILVAAANHKDMIDPALLRPGRFDLHATIDKPNKEGIRKLLEMALGKELPGGIAVDLMNGLLGSSGADVAGFVRQAKAAARAAGEGLQEQHLRATLPKVTNPFANQDLNRIAVHEAGHVIVARHLERPLPDVVRLTNSGGHVASPRARIATLESTLDDVAIDLAGRAAEEVMFGNVSAGAAEDLLYATEMLYAARNLWGLYGDQLVVLPADAGRPTETEAMINAQIDEELQAQYQRAFEIVSVELDPLVLLAVVLLEKREMDRAALEVFFEGESNEMAGHLATNQPDNGHHPKDLTE